MVKDVTTLQQAKELYKTNPSLRNTILVDFTDEELGILPVLKFWNEEKFIEGFRVCLDSYVEKLTPVQHRSNYTKHIFATEKQAQSSLAMAQLSQLMKSLGQECEVDWNDQLTNKYCITRYSSKILMNIQSVSFQFLAFNTKKVRDAFYEKHIDLINQYFQLD